MGKHSEHDDQDLREPGHTSVPERADGPDAVASESAEPLAGERILESALKLRELFGRSHRAVFFGGAGVSTESGIPDFRSSSGLYKMDSGLGYAPETIVSHSFLAAHPKDFWKFYREKMLFPDALPNACHKKLAELERDGHLAAVVTQNIDGLHQAAGSRNVCELHGSVHRNHCTSCGCTFTLSEVLALCEASADGTPHCPSCSGRVRPDVVLYEEALNEEVMTRALEAIVKADLLVIAGTSLAVWPAAGFIQYYQGDDLVVANMSPTSADKDASLVIRDPVGKAFTW